jgi:predicted DNA-binding transcriptional regulator YafY
VVMESHQEVEKASVLFDKEAAKYMREQRHLHGFVSEEDLGDKVRMTFLTSYRRPLARWLLTLGKHVTVESPEKLKETIVELVEELVAYYGPEMEVKA